MAITATAPVWTGNAPSTPAGPPRRRRLGTVALFVPALAFLAVFFVGPLVLMLVESLRDGPGTYGHVLTSEANLKVFANTARTAASTTGICLLLGYPYAYVLNRCGPRLRLVLTALVLLPFWVSLLSRTFAWVGLLQDTGVINSFLVAQGWVDEPLELIRTPLGMHIGMVHVLLPYMVIPLMNTMGTIDPDLLRAAHSLGATPWRRFVRVFLPLSTPGVVAGCVLVFVLALGFYITPAMLGSPSNMMVGELLVQETQKIGTVRASAIGILLLAGTVLSFGLLRTAQVVTSRIREARR